MQQASKTAYRQNQPLCDHNSGHPGDFFLFFKKFGSDRKKGDKLFKGSMFKRKI
jgi:hypothetical protein